MKLVGRGISLCGLLYVDNLPKRLIGFSTYTGVGIVSFIGLFGKASTQYTQPLHSSLITAFSFSGFIALMKHFLTCLPIEVIRVTSTSKPSIFVTLLEITPLRLENISRGNTGFYNITLEK